MANIIRETKREKCKRKVAAVWGRYSAFTKAAFFTVLALFIVCACTIGGFNGGGGAYFAAEDSSVVFYLDYQNGLQRNLILPHKKV